MHTDRDILSKYLSDRLIAVGFVWERTQRPHRQNRSDQEHVFVHPPLLAIWRRDGLSTRATKFYIKPLSDERDCEFGLVTGKTSPLYNPRLYPSPNGIDTHGPIPAWVNRTDDQALDRLLTSVSRTLSDVHGSFAMTDILK